MHTVTPARPGLPDPSSSAPIASVYTTVAFSPPAPSPSPGTEVRRLHAPEVKQIAGRAGRFGSAHPTGHVTCLHQEDIVLLHEAMGRHATPLERACLMPRCALRGSNSLLLRDAVVPYAPFSIPPSP